MSNTEPLTVDITQEKSILQIFPRSPLISSEQAGWKGIQLVHFRQPPHETPTYTPAQHVLSIHLSQVGQEDQWWGDGYFRRETLIQGDISLYSAHCPQRQRWHRAVEFIDLYLDPEWMSHIVEDVVPLKPTEMLPHCTLRDPLILQMGLALKSELELTRQSGGDRPTPAGSRLYAESMAIALVTHLLKHCTTQPVPFPTGSTGLPKSKLKQAIAFIQEHLDQDLSLTAIAHLVGMSPHYFATLFKQSTGMTPHQYVTHCRIEAAKQLLTGTHGAIAEIAQQVGFQTQSHFTTVFRRHTQLTPKAYRDSR